MASRADMIRSARRRVDARRDALGPYGDRPTARDRAIKRYSTTPISSDPFRDKRYQQQGGPRWDQKLGKKIKKFFDKAGEGIMGPYHAMAKAGKELFVDPIRKASENKKILGDVLTDNLRESVMTEKNKEFYKKYMRLADLTSDPDKAREYRETANTALRNAQISSRINYGLGQLGYDTIGKEPFESYLPDFTGGEGTGFEEGASPRFNLVNFLDAFRGTKAGKDFYYGAPGIGGTQAGNEFYNAALAAQAGETGNTMMSNAMKNYGDLTGTGQSMVADLNPRIPYKDTYQDVSISDTPPELFIDNLQHYVGREGINEQRKGYSPETIANMEGYLYGEPGALFGDPAGTYLRASAGSPYDTGARSPLHGIFPNYEVGHPIFSTPTAFGDLENMSEQELLDWGAQNPSDAKLLGFNPNYSDMWLD